MKLTMKSRIRLRHTRSRHVPLFSDDSFSDENSFDDAPEDAELNGCIFEEICESWSEEETQITVDDKNDDFPIKRAPISLNYCRQAEQLGRQLSNSTSQRRGKCDEYFKSSHHKPDINLKQKKRSHLLGRGVETNKNRTFTEVSKEDINRLDDNLTKNSCPHGSVTRLTDEQCTEILEEKVLSKYKAQKECKVNEKGLKPDLKDVEGQTDGQIINLLESFSTFVF